MAPRGTWLALLVGGLGIVACSLSTDLRGLSGGAVLPDADILAADAATTDVVVADAAVDAPACPFGFAGPACTPCPPNRGGATCDFTLVYGLDIPVNANWDTVAEVPYTDDRTATVGAFTRVGYSLALDAEKVWVELDAFTADATRLGVPVDWILAPAIGNVTVHSTASNQAQVVVPVAGNLEFWGNCYGPGQDGKYDHDDDVGGPDCHGSMQIHVAGRPVLAINGWSRLEAPISVGIGAFPDAGRADWTFAENAARFVTRRLEIYVR